VEMLKITTFTRRGLDAWERKRLLASNGGVAIREAMGRANINNGEKRREDLASKTTTEGLK